MRVRKSVSEGYQTKAALNSAAKTTILDGILSEGSQVGSDFVPPRELSPYYGVLKTGGYDPPQSTYCPDVYDVPPLQYGSTDGDSLPASSQQSDLSQESRLDPGPSLCLRKRQFQEDEDDSYAAELVVYEDGTCPDRKSL